MKAITKFLAGGIAIAALASAAPAAAQYFPGYGNPYSYGMPGYGYPGYGYPGYGTGAVIGSIINSVTGNGYGNYGYNVPGGSRIAVSQCSTAVQQRLGGYGGYGYAGGGGRVLGINSVEIRSNGGYKVRGLASVGGAYGTGGPGGAIQFSCRTDPRGFVTDVDVNSGYYGNGYGNGNGYYGQNYANPYSVYGYQRY